MEDDTRAQKGMKIVSLFDQGKQFTEELLKENERLRALVRNLSHEKRQLEFKNDQLGMDRLEKKNQIAQDEIAQLKKEIDALKRETAATEEENREFADRYVEVERQNADLIAMYVASYQLHSTLNYAEVVKIVKDITINMIGAEVFGIYMVDTENQELSLIAEETLNENMPPRIAIDDSISQILYDSNTSQLEKSNFAGEDMGNPIVYIPLKLENEPTGLIIVNKLLIQKEGFHSVDYELVELLGRHAATALYSARMHTVSERKRTTLEGFVNMMKAGTTPKEGETI